MEPIKCNYHPSVNARWTCLECSITLCGNCVEKDTVRQLARCPKCHTELRQIESRNFITPFWFRLPVFFKYPLSLASALFLAFVSMLLAIATFGKMFGLVIFLMCALIYLRYAMDILVQCANGNLRPLRFEVDQLNNGLTLPVKQLIVFIAIGYVLYKLGRAGAMRLDMTYFNFAYNAFLFLLPAQIMLLATEGSLIKSINPLYIFVLIKRLNIAYLVMVGFLLLVSNAWQYVSMFLIKHHFVMLTFLQYFVALYFYTIMFVMMGYVIFQYHDLLDYPVKLDLDAQSHDDALKPVDPGNRSLNEVDLCIKEGQLEQAQQQLVALLAKDGANISLNKRLFDILKLTRQSAALTEHGDLFINVLFANNERLKATDVCLTCLEFDSGFKPGNPNLYKELVNLMKARMAFKQAVAISANFHKRFPDHIDLPDIYFSIAQILSEGLHNDRQAYALLSYLSSTFPNHPLHQQFNQHLVVVGKMLKQS